MFNMFSPFERLLDVSQFKIRHITFVVQGRSIGDPSMAKTAVVGTENELVRQRKYLLLCSEPTFKYSTLLVYLIRMTETDLRLLPPVKTPP